MRTWAPGRIRYLQHAFSRPAHFTELLFSNTLPSFDRNTPVRARQNDLVLSSVRITDTRCCRIPSVVVPGEVTPGVTAPIQARPVERIPAEVVPHQVVPGVITPIDIGPIDLCPVYAGVCQILPVQRFTNEEPVEDLSRWIGNPQPTVGVQTIAGFDGCLDVHQSGANRGAGNHQTAVLPKNGSGGRHHRLDLI